MRIELSKITADQAAQPRSTIEVARVTEYTEDMDRGDKFPPLVVFQEGPRYWLADGFHRFYAATNAGKHDVECSVSVGGLRDAVLYSCGANASHGMRRTNDDKRRAVTRLLTDDEWARWSDREIASRCAVDHKLVATVRKEIGAHTGESASMERTFTHHKTGEPTIMDTAKIGARPSNELEPDSALVGKCLREIERYIDMMPAPADAVAHFPQEQHYMFPLSKIESMAQWLVSFAASWRGKIVEKAHGDATAGR